LGASGRRIAATQRESDMAFVKTPEEMRRLMTAREPPQFYGAEMLLAFWETKPEIVARLLPPPLEVAPYPLACAMVAHYPRTNFGEPYCEGALSVWAQFRGIPGFYCLAMPVTDDMAMAGGREDYGYPKKMAEIHFEQRGSDCTGRISRHGTTYFEIRARFGTDSVDESTRRMIGSGLAFGEETGSPMYLFKHFARPGPAGFDYPPRLVRQYNVFRPERVEWAAAEVALPPCDSDPWHEVELVRPLGGVFTVGHNTMLDGEVVAEVDPAAFLPYAWLKWDTDQLRLPARSAPAAQECAA